MRESTDLEPRPLGLLITAAIFACFSLYAALRTSGIMDQYRRLFADFGAPVPAFTQLVLEVPNFWWVIAVPALAVFGWIVSRDRVTPRQKSRMKLAVIGVLLFGAAIYGLVAYAMYLPIMEMGKAI